MEAERQLHGGQLLAKPSSFQLKYGAENLCVSVDHLSAGWRSNLQGNHQVRDVYVSSTVLCDQF